MEELGPDAVGPDLGPGDEDAFSDDEADDALQRDVSILCVITSFTVNGTLISFCQHSQVNRCMWSPFTPGGSRSCQAPSTFAGRLRMGEHAMPHQHSPRLDPNC